MVKEWHIHVDASRIDADLEEALIDRLGFWRMDFCRTVDEVSYAPERHLTRKFHDQLEFRRVTDETLALVQAGDRMSGYIECEMLPFDDDLPEQPYRITPIPFRLEMRELALGEFRQTEVHVTMGIEESDPRLLEAFREMGFYSASLEKDYGRAIVWTAQGSREHIDAIIPALRGFLDSAGGVARGSIKEERVVRSWVSSDEVRLPPVVDRVVFVSDG